MLAQLSDKGFIQQDDAEIERFIFAQYRDKELPLYLRALVGVGAFVASLCFVGFAALAISLTSEEAFVVWGLLFVALAFGLYKFSKDNNSLKDSFFRQSSFSIMLAGKALFTFGMLVIFESAWGATLAIVVITAATYPFYPLSIDRFLSSFGIFFSILLNLLWDGDIDSSRALLINGLIALQLGLVAILITTVKFERIYNPVLYGLLCSLSVSVLFLTVQTEFGYWRPEDFIMPYFANLLFTAGLMGTLVWIADGVLDRLKTEPFVLALSGAALLGVISASGILLAISLLILGYAKHEKIMIAMGALLLPVFLVAYYYSLDISLMMKSAVLVGSGAAMLGGRFYMVFKGWHKGGTP